MRVVVKSAQGTLVFGRLRVVVSLVALSALGASLLQGMEPESVSVSSAQRALYPLRAVLKITWRGETQTSTCFATLTGPSELRTAGHCVWDHERSRVAPPGQLEVVLPSEGSASRGAEPILGDRSGDTPRLGPQPMNGSRE